MKEKVLALWWKFIRGHRKAFHDVENPDRLANMKRCSNALERIGPIMVRYGHLHPDSLRFLDRTTEDPGLVRRKQTRLLLTIEKRNVRNRKQKANSQPSWAGCKAC